MSSAILIAGAGYVGTALASRLVARGERVFGLRRNARTMPTGVTGISADLSADDGSLMLPREVDRVVYALAPGGGEDAYRAVYVRGLENLRDALVRSGARVRRLILTTSTAVYPQTDGRFVDESSEVGHEGTARYLLEGERIVHESFEEGIALRLAGIYGPGRDRMVRLVAEGVARTPRELAWTNRIHRDDAASALEVLLEVERPRPIYIGVDDAPTDLGSVYEWIANELGMPAPPIEDSGVTRTRGGNKRCLNTLLRGAGWAPAYPSFREGYREAIDARRGTP